LLQLPHLKVAAAVAVSLIVLKDLAETAVPAAAAVVLIVDHLNQAVPQLAAKAMQEARVQRFQRLMVAAAVEVLEQLVLTQSHL
jgi:hypothetical protein